MQKFDCIFQVVYERTGMRKKDVMRKKRSVEYIEARVLFILIASAAGISKYRIAKILNKDHTTILYLFRKFDGMYDVAQDAAIIKVKIGAKAVYKKGDK